MAACNIRQTSGITGRPELMSLVYRIQSKQDRTRGAYQDLRLLRNMHLNTSITPMPYQDKNIMRWPKPNEFCGCASAAALLQWFKGAIPDLLRAGYKIVALRDVTVTAIGEFQVLFTFNT